MMGDDHRQVIDGMMEGEDEDEMRGLDDIDPELLEAAQKLGLDDDGIRALQQ